MNISSFVAAAAATLSMLMGTASSTPPTAQHCVSIERPLSYGSTGGADVVKLQLFLGVKPTGYFGPTTMRALTTWQVSTGVILSPSSGGAGAVGPKTRAALACKGTSVATTTPTNVTTSSLHTIVPTAVPTSSAATSAPTVPQNPLPPVNAGGGGGVSAPATPVCPAFTTPMPAASKCTTGPWQVIEDEAGCPAEWDCSDPNATE